MPTITTVYHEAPEELLALVKSHLPYSVPLLRRLQYTKRFNRLTPTSRVVLAYDSSENGKDLSAITKFTAAYVDVGGGPDTQMWLYSTLERQDHLNQDESTFYEDQLNSLVNEIIRIARDYGKPLVHPGTVLLGTLHSTVRGILEKSGRVRPRPTGFYDKWLFKAEDLPVDDSPLPEGMYWDVASEDDCRVVISRTDIPRTVEGLSQMPSLVIKTADGIPISWAFLGFDGSLASLHCEPEYRRRGFAKKLAAKLFRERTQEFSDDGWCSADVSPDNDGSRGMCLRLNGKTYWQLSWILLDVSEQGGVAEVAGLVGEGRDE